MLTKRIIPCLDIRDGQTVKGVNFVDIIDAGDPVELGKSYVQQGADELIFLDITATIENRQTFALLVEKIALNVNIPFTVGGGIRSEDDVSRLLDAGADKITVNSAAVAEPGLGGVLIIAMNAASRKGTRMAVEARMPATTIIKEAITNIILDAVVLREFPSMII